MDKSIPNKSVVETAIYMNNKIVATKKTTKKSRLQTRYEKLIADIQLNKSLQVSLEEDFRKLLPRIQKEIRPLLSDQTTALRKRLLRVDELADEIGVGKLNWDWLASYMAEESLNILNERGFDDKELFEMYEKYAGESPMPDQEHMEDVAASIEDAYGFKVDVEEMLKKGMGNYLNENAEKLRKQHLENIEEEEARELEDFDPAATKKVSKQDQVLLQDAKTIYMRLVKRFHPDLEQDEQRKIEKTAIVQEVTKAYNENDFLKLLSLQIEHIDEKEKEGEALADDMLKRYNKVLSKQLAEIKDEIDYIKFSSSGMFEDFFDRNNKFSERKFRAFKKELKTGIVHIEEYTQNSYKRPKGWFKDFMREIKDHRTNQLMEEAFANIFHNFQ